MKNTIKVLGIIALAAVIGFSVAGCGGKDDDTNPQSGGVLSAPYLTKTESGTIVYFSWNSISDASGYNFYVRVSFNGIYSDWDWVRISATSDYEDLADYVGTGYTFEFKVAAYNSNGTEGAHSNVVSVTVRGGTSQPQPNNTSLNGTWEHVSSYGGGHGTPGTQKSQITVSGNTGRLTRSSNSPLSQSAMNKGMYNLNSIMWKDLTSNGYLKWTGQTLEVLARTSSPDVAVVALYYACTITMSADGQTITMVTPWSYENSSGTVTSTWTRRY